MATNYLPELDESMQTALKKVDASMQCKTTDVEWKTFKRFEGSIEDGMKIKQFNIINEKMLLLVNIVFCLCV